MKKLYFFGVKNEYESCQLVINSENNIERVKLIPSNIESGDSVISKECFEVYYVNYSQVKNGSPLSIAYKEGLYPDALIEQSICINSVNSPKCIKSFWITLKIPKDCSQGTYRGTFQLIIDNSKVEIPVEIEVADYVLSDKSTMDTSFGIFADYLDPMYPVDEELLEKCFDEHYKYRINPFLHFSKYPSSDKIVALVDKYFDNPRFTSFGLPDLFGAKNIEDRIDVFRDTILLLAQKSTKDRNLLSKIYVYYFDEPEGNKIVDIVEKSFDYYNKTLKSILDEINADDTGKYSEFKAIKDYATYILNIKNLSTPLLDTCSGIIQENTHICCPSYANFTDRKFVEQAKAVSDRQGHQIWWYGCGGPLYPFPTYHIADRLITSRVLNWMQYSYDVEGLLNWRSFGVWTREIGKIDNVNRETEYGCKPFGDGFLFYYGSICNQKAPLPSIRLMSIRDGIEEFELLRALELKYDEYKKHFDCSFESKRAVKTICDKLFDNVYAVNSQELFDCVRRELINKLSNKYKIPYAVGSIETQANKGVVTIYTVRDASLSINGIELEKNPNGVYSYNFDLRCGVTALNVKVSCNGENEEHVERICDHIDYFDKISCQQCKEAFSVENAQFKLDVCYSPIRTKVISKGVNIELKYTSDAHPEIYFDISSIDKDLLKNANKVSFSVYNSESRSLTIFEKLCGEGNEVDLEANELFPNRENTLNVEISFLKDKIDFVPEKLKLILRNTYPEDNKKDMKIIIDSVKIRYNE